MSGKAKGKCFALSHPPCVLTVRMLFSGEHSSVCKYSFNARPKVSVWFSIQHQTSGHPLSVLGHVMCWLVHPSSSGHICAFYIMLGCLRRTTFRAILIMNGPDDWLMSVCLGCMHHEDMNHLHADTFGFALCRLLLGRTSRELRGRVKARLQGLKHVRTAPAMRAMSN